MGLKKNVAYDLSLFEAQVSKERKRYHGGEFIFKDNILKLSKKQLRTDRKFKLKPQTLISVIFIFSLVLSVVVNLIRGQVDLSELAQEIHTTNKILDEAKSIETQLKIKLESNLSLRDAEEYSREFLKMQKPESNQVEYVSILDKNKTEIAE